MNARIITIGFPTPWGQHWQAWDDRLGADASPIGDGATEAAAIDDLENMLADMDDAK
jgi:hypothetical protein